MVVHELHEVETEKMLSLGKKSLRINECRIKKCRSEWVFE